jgi:hypothetical protein
MVNMRDAEGYCEIPLEEPAFIEKARMIPGISERVINILHFSRFKGKEMRIDLDARSRITLDTKGRISVFPKRKHPRKSASTDKREKFPYKRANTTDYI